VAGLLVALLAATAAAYAVSIDGALQFDDLLGIDQNPAVKDLGRFVAEALAAGPGAGRRLVPELTFALNYAQGGLAPRPYHLTSLGFHLAAVLALFLLGRRLLRQAGWARPEGAALAAAALWALHPLNSQAVNYVYQRAEVLASLFYALTVLLVLEAARRGRTRGGVAAYAAALLTAWLAFESKPIAVSLPAAVLAALLVTGLPEVGAGRGWTARLALALPFGAAALRYGTSVIGSVAGHADVGFSVPALHGFSYPATQARVVLEYLRQVAWPTGLSLDHDVVASRTWGEPAVLACAGALLLLGGATAAAAWWGSRPGREPALGRATRVAAFGVAWFFVLLAPTSSVVPIVDLQVDHRPYLASWGILLAGVALARAALERWPGSGPRAARAGLVTTLALCAGLAGWLAQRNLVWADPVATWTDVVQQAPGRWRGWHNLAQVVGGRGDHARALQLLARALPLARQPEERLATLRNTGANLLQLDRQEEAYRVLLEADAIPLDDAGVQNNLAIILEARGALAEAEARARRAMEIAPDFPNAHTTLGQVLARRGDLAGALQAFQRAAALNPDELPPLNNLAMAQELLGQRVEACATWARYGEARAGAMRSRAEQRRSRLGCGDGPPPR
jgi:tetratricopeptide (TPR) repeat protein